ncbi:MAG: DUF3375 domain-containing protein [Fuerstiella sp.]|nr:DUF3375 domain-containing protein [Fuerstiella sp.]MCP4512535.1 DUF3375 domain-containing protein [Fuerstiella sp.]
MDTSTLLMHFESSPAIRLLRAGNAPWIIAFLYAQFKHSEKITIPQSELLPALGSFQEDLQLSWPEALRSSPETYLADWCSPNKPWLHRFLEAGRDEPTYQLTQHCEDVIEFLGQSLQKDIGFVGTESRLRLVIETLQQLVVGASCDPTVHLDELRKQKAIIDEQIEKIERGEEVPAFHPTRIREQFNLAVTMLKELERDFRAVEERFREITQDVRRKQIRGMDTRGGILGAAMDAEDALRRDDQGVSFYEFFRLIQSTEQQRQLRAIIQQLPQIPELAEQTEGLHAIRRMMPLLLSEAAKVTQTERRLSSTLRRLLDAGAHRESQRSAELLREIQGLAAAMAANPPRDEVAFEVDDAIRLQSPVSRQFWAEPTEFEVIDLTEHTDETGQRDNLFREFSKLQRIDFQFMRAQISEAIRTGAAVTLGELLDTEPPQSGIMDVLGYIQIATEDGHIIDHDLPQEIVIPSGVDGRRALIVTVPRVIFAARSAVVQGPGHGPE